MFLDFIDIAQEFYVFGWQKSVCVSREYTDVVSWTEKHCVKVPMTFEASFEDKLCLSDKIEIQAVWSNPICNKDIKAFEIEFKDTVCLSDEIKISGLWSNPICTSDQVQLSASWSNPVCTKDNESFEVSFSDQLCVVEEHKLSASWSNTVCVKESNEEGNEGDEGTGEGGSGGNGSAPSCQAPLLSDWENPDGGAYGLVMLDVMLPVPAETNQRYLIAVTFFDQNGFETEIINRWFTFNQGTINPYDPSGTGHIIEPLQAYQSYEINYIRCENL